MPLFILPFLAYDDFDVILPFSFAPKLLMSLKSSSKDDISGRLFVITFWDWAVKLLHKSHKNYFLTYRTLANNQVMLKHIFYAFFM